jgi:NADPH-ferrihemoprotein reductase
MATVLKLFDTSLLESTESIFQHAQADDIVFFALIALTGLFWNFYLKEKPDPYHHIWFERPQVSDENSKRADTRDIGLKLEEIVCLGDFPRFSKREANIYYRRRTL